MVYIALADQEPSKKLIASLKNALFYSGPGILYFLNLLRVLMSYCQRITGMKRKGIFINLDGKVQSTKKS